MKQYEPVVGVCGSRGHSDRKWVERFVDGHFAPRDVKLIIHGGCRNSPDMWVDKRAREIGIHCAKVDALWGFAGKSAGHRRNATMVSMLKYMSAPLVAFWDGRSKGTMDMIKRCRGNGIVCHVFEPKPFYEPPAGDPWGLEASGMSYAEWHAEGDQ